MDTAWLLKQPFATALIFRESSGSSTTRSVFVVDALKDGKLLVLEQGMINAIVKRVTIEELTAKAWPDLELSYYDSAVRFDMAMRLWLPHGTEARELMNRVMLRGRDMAVSKIAKKAFKKATTIVEPPKPVSPYPGIFVDYQRRTCIAFERYMHRVSLIPMAEGAPFELEDWDEEMFDRRFTKRLDDYPVDRAARLYATYATELGASEEALEKLSLHTTVSEKERQMATTKKAAAPAKTPTAKKGAEPKAAAKKGAAAPVKKGAAAPTEKKEAKPRAESAASMFQSLLLEGKHTDDAIFAKVAAKHGLDEKKRSYVGWYRNYLRKSGKEVADPIQK